MRQYDFEYDREMERVTATIDDEVIGAIRRVAGRRGVSAFLQAAGRERLLDELDAKHGPPSRRVRAEVASKARRAFRR